MGIEQHELSRLKGRQDGGLVRAPGFIVTCIMYVNVHLRRKSSHALILSAVASVGVLVSLRQANWLT